MFAWEYYCETSGWCTTMSLQNERNEFAQKIWMELVVTSDDSWGIRRRPRKEIEKTEKYVLMYRWQRDEPFQKWIDSILINCHRFTIDRIALITIIIYQFNQTHTAYQNANGARPTQHIKLMFDSKIFATKMLTITSPSSRIDISKEFSFTCTVRCTSMRPRERENKISDYMLQTYRITLCSRFNITDRHTSKHKIM